MSYGTLEGWRAYAAARGDGSPADADDLLASAALTRAADYIKYNYVAYFMAGYDENLPVVELATYEAASYELTTPNFFSVVFTPAQQKVLTEMDGIKWTPVMNTDSIEAFNNATPTSTRIDAMLRRYLPSKGGAFIKSVG